MSSNAKVDESPNHFMILDAVNTGINNRDKIARGTKLPKEQVELIIEDLLAQRLIVNIEKTGFFRKKKIEIGITETGIKLLNAKKKDLEEKRRQMQQSYDNGDGALLQSYMGANRTWIPMMLFSGIMDMMFFTSMMSFMGWGMNPMESAMIGSGSYDDTSNSGEMHSADDHSGTSGENSDSSSSDGQDFDSSGGSFDSGSFDGFDSGGGFDGF